MLAHRRSILLRRGLQHYLKNEYPPADVTFRDEIKTHPLVYKWYVMEVVEKKAEEEEEEADLPALSSG